MLEGIAEEEFHNRNNFHWLYSIVLLKTKPRIWINIYGQIMTKASFSVALFQLSCEMLCERTHSICLLSYTSPCFKGWRKWGRVGPSPKIIDNKKLSIRNWLIPRVDYYIDLRMLVYQIWSYFDYGRLL